MAKHLKSFIFATFIVTLFCSLKIAAAETVQTRLGSYVFTYQPADSLLARRLFGKVQPGLRRVQQFFGGQPTTTITIYLTPSSAEYLRRSGGRVPEWSGAVAFTRQQYIVLRLASAEDIQSAPQTLLHELVHMHVAAFLPEGRMPVWLNEGLAQYLSYKELTLNEKVLLANALALKRLPVLSALDSLLQFSPPKARLAYSEALTAVQFFVRRNGVGALKQLVRTLASERSLQAAFKKVTGSDALDFELAWYADLYESYRWLVILNLDNLIWTAMALLALVAIFAVRRRNRKKVAAWEAEGDLNEDHVAIDEQKNKNLEREEDELPGD